MKKPFYLEEDYGKLKAYHIFTRTGDRNTPRNKNANFIILNICGKNILVLI